MKKQKKQSLLNAIIIILILALIMMIGSIVYEEKINMSKQPTQNTVSPVEKQEKDTLEDEEETTVEDNAEEELTDEKTEETIDEKQEYVGEEENNTQEDTTKINDEKAINLVKKIWGNDDSVTFSIEQKNGNKYYVAVKGSNTETAWYEVDTETWEISEY